MARERVFRNIDRRPQYLGLEPIDLLTLGFLLWFLLTFNPQALALDGLVLAVCYVALRVSKRGKPAGHTADVLRYAFSRRTFLSASEVDIEGRANPFPHKPS